MTSDLKRPASVSLRMMLRKTAQVFKAHTSPIVCLAGGQGFTNT